MNEPSRAVSIGIAVSALVLVVLGAVALQQAGRARGFEQENRELRGRVARLELALAEARAEVAAQASAHALASPIPPASPPIEAPAAPIPLTAPEEPVLPTPPDAAPFVEELTPPPAPSSVEEAPVALAEVARRGRGRVRVPLRTGELALELVHVPPGVGWLGTDPDALPPAERAARALIPSAGFSAPRVRVVLEGGYLIGAREITNAEYLAVLEAAGVDLAGRRTRRGYLSHLETVAAGWEREPVRGVTWDEASEYCALLGKLLDAPVRLPSEIEWELAAAGLGDAPRRRPWGGADEGRDLTPEGVKDLGLSLHEWCLERWEPRRWSSASVWLHRPSLVEVPAPAPSDAMTCRGGSLESRTPLHTECAWRQGRLASTRGRTLGFRIAIPLE